MHVPTIVIIGGGASGTMCAIALLRRSVPVRVVLVESGPRVGTGLAYATDDPQHLLNSPAGRMTAIPGQDEHLLRWAGRHGIDATPGCFLPRGTYGRYLADTLDEARAGSAGTLVPVTGETVVDLLPGRRTSVRLASGGSISADAVVLAVGPQQAGRGDLPGACRAWVDDIGDIGVDGGPVLIAGTGLSMVDVALTVTSRHPSTTVLAVSGHGLLPHRHRPRSGAAAHPASTIGDAPGGSLLDLMRALRRAVAEEPEAWRELVDALRPELPRIWCGLGMADRQRFVERFGRFWEVHRHRMAPSVADRLAALRASGRVTLRRGRIVDTVAEGPRMRAVLDTPAGTESVRVHSVVDCRGGAGPDPLVAALERAGRIRRDPLGLGLDVDDDGHLLDAAGRPHRAWTALGPPRRGALWECTAVPEIRSQAGALADLLMRELVGTARTDVGRASQPV